MAAVPGSAAPSPGPAPSPAALLGPCIERIFAGAAGRKHTKLRQDAKVRRRLAAVGLPGLRGRHACCHHVRQCLQGALLRMRALHLLLAVIRNHLPPCSP